jgi:H+/Cl- antiporter ClcA
MDKTSIVKSIVYSLGQITLGLFLHPYQSMQNLVRDQVFMPLMLLPTLLAGIFYVLFAWWLLTLFYDGSLIFRLVYRSFFFFFLYWQILLIYLFWRFKRAFRN